MGFLSNLARERALAPAQDGEWAALFGQGGTGSGIPLGTARWMAPDAALEKFLYPEGPYDGRVWIGEAFDREKSPLGYKDDRHVCLVSGSRGGKGVGVLVPNLCFWPGSCIVVDPKGENATVTARRRGGGSEYAHGLGQKVCILDPFGEAQLPVALKARYNPLDAIDPKSDLAVDDAGRIAAAIVVVESKNDPYWENAARNLIRGLILHVVSSPAFEGRRTLVTVRRLLTQGHWLLAEKLRSSGDYTEEDSAFGLLWTSLRRNNAFDGVVSGVAEQITAMADKQRSGVLEAARTNTEFLDSVPMQRMLETSDFDLGELKTNPQGLTIYLTLPQRFMETHYRWLRLMISLAVGEMERIKIRPATGHPTLFLLDEFAGLKRMEVVEHAAAQAAGFGIKFMFVVQNLAQLNEVYDKGWETFFGNSGLKLFFQIDDDFTRSYLSRQLGELETARQTHSGSESQSASWSTSDGRSSTSNYGSSSGLSRGRSVGHSLNFAGLFRIFSKSHSNQLGASRSWSDSKSWGRATGTSFSRSQSGGDSTTSGWSEGLHKRPLLNPDEIGRLLARVDDRRRPGYPGLVLALVPGEHPLLARRVNYFESPRFLGYFDPHPQHPPPPPLSELNGFLSRLKFLDAGKYARPWLLRPYGGRVLNVLEGLADVVAPVVAVLLVCGFAYALFHQQQLNINPAEAAAVQPLTTAMPAPTVAIPVAKEAPEIVHGNDEANREPLSSPTQTSESPSQNNSSSAAPAAYARGVADRGTFEAWLAKQTGDRRAGADYWAANRNVSGHVFCADAADNYSGDRQLFTAGCRDAAQQLDPIDQSRAGDPQYRDGFDADASRALASLSPQNQVAGGSTDQTAASAGTTGSSSYQRGVADWDAQQAWFNAQTGDRRAGADYWAANRNVSGHVFCADAADNYSGDRQLFTAGCRDAAQLLDPIDQSRGADQQYRAGFNDEAQRSTSSSQPDNTSESPSQNNSSSAAPGLSPSR